MKPNRLCKACGTYYRDPGGKVGDPKRYCPKCGSWAWYWVDDREEFITPGEYVLACLIGIGVALVVSWFL